MRISRYDILLKVVACGSFNRAAEQLGYTQSALSQAVASLEDELGVTLLNRTRHGVSLSPDGELLFPDVMAICNAQRNLVNRISAIHHVLVGTVRIGTFTSISCRLLPDAICRFTSEYPKVTFELMHGNYHEIENWLLSGTADLGFLKLPVSGSLDVFPLERERVVAILPLSHPLAASDSVPVQQLAKEKFILLEEGNNAEITPIFEDAGIEPDIAYRMKDDYTVMSFVERGLGIGILPERVLTRTPYHIAVRPLSPPAFRTIGIAKKHHAPLSTAAQTFLQELEPNFSSR